MTACPADLDDFGENPEFRVSTTAFVLTPNQHQYPPVKTASPYRAGLCHQYAPKPGRFADSVCGYEARRGVRLSAAGRRRALEILRHH